jgi:hypothetical protein
MKLESKIESLLNATVLGTDYGLEYITREDGQTEACRKMSFYGEDNNGEIVSNTYYIFLDGTVQFMLNL